jgi:long-chain acyl-CoA synthetase
VRNPDDIALIIYAAGTRKDPRGAMITFANLSYQVAAVGRRMGVGPGDRLLSILPLNHLFELTTGLLCPLFAGATVTYAQSLFPQEVVRLLRVHRVTILNGVPLFLAALGRHVARDMGRRSRAWRLWFQLAMVVARALPWRRARRTLFFPVHRWLGGALRMMGSGGAPLDAFVARFFDLLGLPLVQGYGLTETGPVITANSAAANRIGTVGQPLDGLEVRIGAKDDADEGEILTRGPHVMKGYYNRPDLTVAAIDAEGWFHTGDLGRIDSDGYLTITGRIKPLIVLGNGKKIHPAEIEEAFANSPDIAEICVLGRPVRVACGQGSEEVCVVAVPANSLAARIPDTEALAARVRHCLAKRALEFAPFKRPSRVVVRFAPLPRTSDGAVDGARLAHWLTDRLEAPSRHD